MVERGLGGLLANVETGCFCLSMNGQASSHRDVANDLGMLYLVEVLVGGHVEVPGYGKGDEGDP
jgi:hypothetical protein